MRERTHHGRSCWFAAIISVAAHVAVVPVYMSETRSVPEFASFVPLLVGIDFSLSIVGHIMRRLQIRFVFLGVRALIVVVAALSCVDGDIVGTALAVAWYGDLFVSSRPGAALAAAAVFFVVWASSLLPPQYLGISGAGLNDPMAPGVPPAAAVSVLVVGLWFIIGRLIADSRTARVRAFEHEEAIRRLTEANTGFQEYARLLEERSIQNERKRITREVHDTTGYALTNLSMLLSAAKLTVTDDPVATVAMIEKARDLVQACLRETRIVLRKLRSLSSVPEPGVPTFLRLIRTFEASTGTTIRVEWGNIPRSFGEEINETVYRIVQEGLTNAFRHSRADRVDVLFRVADGILHVSILDNGSVSTEFEEGLGLRGMRERVEAVRGEISFIATRYGFRVLVKIPVFAE